MTAGLRDLIEKIESGWHNLPVLVVGDVMLDQYVWGEVERISPEAPVPVVRTMLREEKPGGAANVATNLARLGARVTLAGFAGGDREQETLELLLAADRIDSRLTPAPASPTTTKLRILSGHQQMMRVDRDGGSSFSAVDYRALLESALSALPGAAAVVLSDYAKGTLSEEVCQTVIGRAREANIPVLVDPKHTNFQRYRGATTVCPNRKELAAATGLPATDLEHLLSATQSQLALLQVDFVTVTLGEQGIAVVRKDSRVHAPAVGRQVYDVSGAGDTVIAVLALSMASGIRMEDAIQLANLAAGIVVGKAGTVPIEREELLGALTQEISLEMDDKVLEFDRLMMRASSWKSSGQRVVFTNGCFDLLHVGHIRLLEAARHNGDRLIVAVNGDESVRRLKGPTRPIVAASERARVLAALSAVDAVILFEDDTPLRLIEAIRPDVLVKGGDYTEDRVVGGQEVRSWGGRVELIPLVADVSTTRLIVKSKSDFTPYSVPGFSA